MAVTAAFLHNKPCHFIVTNNITYQFSVASDTKLNCLILNK
ncbi:hypothetical protein PLIP_a0732 [Pseudoalteromonas lipolytica LMEB 39]|nr:hypothetical protein [Pseudoalteromonas lipolytica LMEB 39]